MVELVTIWTERAKKAKERLEICEQCDRLEKHLYVCKECGCFMKGKTKFPSSKCPLGKWDKYNEKKDG